MKTHYFIYSKTSPIFIHHTLLAWKEKEFTSNSSEFILLEEINFHIFPHSGKFKLVLEKIHEPLSSIYSYEKLVDWCNRVYPTEPATKEDYLLARKKVFELFGVYRYLASDKFEQE